MGFRGSFTAMELEEAFTADPPGGYRIDPIAVVTRQIHLKPILEG